LAAFGANPSFMWAGFLPAGVAAVTSEGASLGGAKIIQIMLCTAPTLIAFAGAGRRGLGLTRITLRGLLGIYVTSAYWEMLSLTSYVPMMLHETVYIGLSIAAALALPRSISRLSGMLAKRLPSLTAPTTLNATPSSA
jgi:hypothetical protein